MLTCFTLDPEEFLSCLLTETLKAPPLLHFSTGQSALLYQLIVEKDEQIAVPSVQQLFDQSIVTSNIKFKEVSPGLNNLN